MRTLLFFIISLFAVQAYGQRSFSLINPKKNTFSFENSGNLVILPVKVNGIELSFLLDTGVKETILFASQQDTVPLENINKVKFSGIGIEDGVEGIMAVNNTIEIGGILQDSTHNLFVIDAEELDISSHVGIPINGILGSRFFDDFLVKIDYIKSKISVFDPFSYPQKTTRGFTEIPISIERSRPYVHIDLNLGDINLPDSKMLVDMGNSDGLLIFPFLLQDFQVRDPRIYDFIGRGFNGLIYGFRNRIKGFEWAGFFIKQPIVSYPDSNAVHAAKLTKDRIGSIGNQALQHFQVIFNYAQSKMYLKKNKNFGKPFLINLTGMDIKHDGLVWTQQRIPTSLSRTHKGREDALGGTTVYNQQEFTYEFSLKPIYKISNIRQGSSAGKSGLQVDDELIAINGRRVQNLKMKQIMDILQHNEGEELKVTVQRGEQQLHFTVLLEDPIPYR